MPAPDPDAIEIIEWEGGYSVLFPSWPNGCPRTLAARAKAILRNLRRNGWRCMWCGDPVPTQRRADAEFCSERCRKAAKRRMG